MARFLSKRALTSDSPSQVDMAELTYQYSELLPTSDCVLTPQTINHKLRVAESLRVYRFLTSSFWNKCPFSL